MSFIWNSQWWLHVTQWNSDWLFISRDYSKLHGWYQIIMRKRLHTLIRLIAMPNRSSNKILIGFIMELLLNLNHVPHSILLWVQSTVLIYFQVVMIEFRSCDSETGCCDLVFTSIKDCLLLECAFNCIGTCISLWLLLIVWRKKLSHDHRRHSSIAITNGLSYWSNGYGTS